jgi:hypothetical protein
MAVSCTVTTRPPALKYIVLILSSLQTIANEIPTVMNCMPCRLLVRKIYNYSVIAFNYSLVASFSIMR